MAERYQQAFVLTMLLMVGSAAFAKEYPIGKPQSRDGMEIGAVYLQPITMEPAGVMRAAETSDVHLEADIKAGKDNKNGYAQGDWIPALSVHYELKKDDVSEPVTGDFMPMVASDGPHYGDNVKLQGVGRYKLRLTIDPPGEGLAVHTHFGRHVDKETGVAPWFRPFTVEYDFVYAGVGKKGAY